MCNPCSLPCSRGAKYNIDIIGQESAEVDIIIDLYL